MLTSQVYEQIPKPGETVFVHNDAVEECVIVAEDGTIVIGGLQLQPCILSSE
jgi:hypothetical protein